MDELAAALAPLAGMVCDAHVHVGPSDPWMPELDPSGSLADMDAALSPLGTRRSLVFPNPSTHSYPERNRDLASLARGRPDLVPFGRVDPRHPDAVAHVEEVARLGMRGLKLHPVVECFRPDHTAFYQVFERARELGLALSVHTGSGFAAPDHLKGLAGGATPLILCHLSQGCLPLLRRRNVFADTSGCGVRTLAAAVRRAPRRVLFGSDYPYLDPRVELAKVLAAVPHGRVRKLVLRGNFQRVFDPR
ncbi:MAG: amidohydrolase family protein [Methanopyri archaeon]|nr:amidohydrolase family protein [Methanopyri archaeon]